MTEPEIESILADYSRSHLSPTENERVDISRKYEQLKDFLKGRAFQNGSYARHTSTTPVNDLDVIYELPEDVRKSVTTAAATIDPSRLVIHDIIATLAKELKDFYGSSATIKPQPHSVGVYFGTEEEFSIDVVPALSAGNDLYWVPETAHLSVAKRRQVYKKNLAQPAPNWIKSDPKGYIDQATKLDEATKGNFRKAAKITKKWRWRWKKANDEFPLKSFHVELVVADYFKNRNDSSLLDVAVAFIKGLGGMLAKPSIPDKADSSRFIDQYIAELNERQKAFVIDAQRSSLRELDSILSATTPDQVRVALEQFLGVSSRPGLGARIGVAVLDTLGSARRIVLRGLRPLAGREDKEEFLSDFGITTNLRFKVRINATVTQDGFRPFKLLGSGFPLKKSRSLEFYVDACDVPKPYQVKWKVKNTGAEAARVGQLRGQIYDDEGHERRKESTKYWGNHYVECFIIKDGVCVAADHIDVDIGSG